MFEFVVEIDRDHSFEFEEMLDAESINYRVRLMESFGAPEIILIALTSIQTALQVLQWLKQKKQKDKTVKIEVTMRDGTDVNLQTVNAEKLEMFLKDKKRAKD